MLAGLTGFLGVWQAQRVHLGVEPADRARLCVWQVRTAPPTSDFFCLRPVPVRCRWEACRSALPAPPTRPGWVSGMGSAALIHADGVFDRSGALRDAGTFGPGRPALILLFSPPVCACAQHPPRRFDRSDGVEGVVLAHRGVDKHHRRGRFRGGRYSDGLEAAGGARATMKGRC